MIQTRRFIVAPDLDWWDIRDRLLRARFRPGKSYKPESSRDGSPVPTDVANYHRGRFFREDVEVKRWDFIEVPWVGGKAISHTVRTNMDPGKLEEILPVSEKEVCPMIRAYMGVADPSEYS